MEKNEPYEETMERVPASESGETETENSWCVDHEAEQVQNVEGADIQATGRCVFQPRSMEPGF